MKTRFLRRIANRYGAGGLLFVGACLAVRHLWMKRTTRALVAACSLCLVATVYVSYLRFSQMTTICTMGVGERRMAFLRVGPTRPVDDRILACFEEHDQTKEVRKLARSFSAHVERGNRDGAVKVGKKLYRWLRYKKSSSWSHDRGWNVIVASAGIYMEQGWLEEAEAEFTRVIAAVPSTQLESGGSPVRRSASYGLSRVHSLKGDFEGALSWLKRSPREYSSWCGNCRTATDIRNYPLEVVWTAASKPLSVAQRELRDIMLGRFTPRMSSLTADTSQEQREEAMAEAALTLGCLDAKNDRIREAEAMWSLIAGDGTSQTKAAILSRAMLRRTRGNAG